MSKDTKNAVLCRKGELPERLGDVLYNADETDLRVLVTLLLLADGNGEVEDTDAVCEVLGLEHAAVTGAMKFWRGAGLLEAVGKDFTDVVKTTCFLADMDDFAAFNGVYGKYFTEKPARCCVAVKTLPRNVLCEVEIIVYLG